MDIFDYCKNRIINPDEVFDQTNLEADGIRGIATWDIVFLERYVKEKMIPRSLRWHVYPDKGDVEIGEWFLYFNGVGLSFLDFLLSKKINKVAKLQLEINDIKEILIPMSKEGLYQVYTNELQDILIEEEEEQRIKKRKKYLRDVEDYKCHNVFKWQENHRESFIKPT